MTQIPAEPAHDKTGSPQPLVVRPVAVLNHDHPPDRIDVPAKRHGKPDRVRGQVAKIDGQQRNPAVHLDPSSAKPAARHMPLDQIQYMLPNMQTQHRITLARDLQQAAKSVDSLA